MYVVRHHDKRIDLNRDVSAWKFEPSALNHSAEVGERNSSLHDFSEGAPVV